jgi:hypothetical protein
VSKIWTAVLRIGHSAHDYRFDGRLESSSGYCSSSSLRSRFVGAQGHDVSRTPFSVRERFTNCEEDDTFLQPDYGNQHRIPDEV